MLGFILLNFQAPFPKEESKAHDQVLRGQSTGKHGIDYLYHDSNMVLVQKELSMPLLPEFTGTIQTQNFASDVASGLFSILILEQARWWTRQQLMGTSPEYPYCHTGGNWRREGEPGDSSSSSRRAGRGVMLMQPPGHQLNNLVVDKPLSPSEEQSKKICMLSRSYLQVAKRKILCIEVYVNSHLLSRAQLFNVVGNCLYPFWIQNLVPSFEGSC